MTRNVIEALHDLSDDVLIDHRVHARYEMTNLCAAPALEALLRRPGAVGQRRRDATDRDDLDGVAHAKSGRASLGSTARPFGSSQASWRPRAVLSRK